ncbi:hypothetical protein E2C01_013797 [Portunus trituberculatus]|uniref:Uncharacterized protein n=1 Tax=Portunus trituberculatus TaxID=210409 RepID=A0A5B7DI31_PORTR|nr:hypothetical protein [Portunus trituberculatus]
MKLGVLGASPPFFLSLSTANSLQRPYASFYGVFFKCLGGFH